MGSSDIVWRSSSTGQAILWLMNNGQNGKHHRASAATRTGRRSQPETSTATDSRDIIWRSSSTGQAILWLMNNGQNGNTIALGGNKDWKPVVTGDVNGDGTSDII